jgi:PTS system mannose-specific IID component
MTPMLAAVARLLLIQGSWTYERLQGVGFGYASLPLLKPLAGDRERHRAAVARAAEYFNAHPYLTGIAVGAAARVELDGLAGSTVQRLKTALAGPLGSLGDQLFWIGVVPATMASILIAVTFGGGLGAVGLGLLLYLNIRIATTVWGLRLGLRSGLGISAELRRSGLADAVRRVGLLAGLLIGAALPITAEWLGDSERTTAVSVAVAIGAVAGVLAAMTRWRVPSSRRFTLVAMLAVLLWSLR